MKSFAQRIRRLLPALCSIALSFLSGCSSEGDDRFPPYDNSAEVDAHYADKKDFYHFKTPADIPADLVWENGADLPEIGDPRAKKGGDFRYFVDQFPSTYRVDGPEANGSFRSEHWDNIYVTTVIAHPNVQGKYAPGVAASWAVAPDKRTVYFKLDPDASFTIQDPKTMEWSQSPVRVDDFFFLFFLQTNDYLQDPWAKNHYGSKYSSITRFDDLTFAVTLAEPKADPVYWCSLVPYCREYFKDFGPDFVERFNWRTNPTVGAYAIDLSQTIKNRKAVLKRIPNWWAKDKKNYRYRYNADRLIYTVIGNMDKAFEVFRKGDIDFFPLNSPRYWNEKMDIPEYNNGYIAKTTFFNQWPRPPYGLYVNCSKPLLNNLDIRMGLQHAMHMQRIIDVDMRGDYQRLNHTAEGYGVYTEPTVRSKPYDPELARQYFAKAGYTTPDGDGVLLNAAKQRLSVGLLVRSAPPTHKQYALRLKQEALRAGLQIEIEVLDNVAGFTKILEKKHDLTLTAWSSTPPYPRFWEGYHSANAYEMLPDKSGFKTNPDGSRIVKPNTNNISMTSNPELDKLIDAYEKAATTEELRTLAHQCSKLIDQEASFIPGWNINFLRCGYWQWVKWPEDFNVAQADLPESTFVWWIDTEEKAKVERQYKDNQVLGKPQLYTFDKYREAAAAAPTP